MTRPVVRTKVTLPRRAVLGLLAGLPLASCARTAPSRGAWLEALGVPGGHGVLFVRHALTDDFEEDLEALVLQDCRTQRNLSDEGADQAAELRRFLRAAGARFDEVLSSPFCRCLDTARLGWGPPRIEPDLLHIQGLSDEEVAARIEAFTAIGARAESRGRVVLAVGHSDLPEAMGLARPGEGEGILLVHDRGRMAEAARLVLGPPYAWGPAAG